MSSIFFAIFENPLFLHRRIAIFISSTLSALQISVLRSLLSALRSHTSVVLVDTTDTSRLHKTKHIVETYKNALESMLLSD